MSEKEVKYNFLIEFRNFFIRLWLYFLQLVKRKSLETPPPPESLVKKNKEFVDETKDKFLKVVEKEKKQSSSQIDSLFYDVNAYKKAMMESDNEYEKTWRTRILIKTVPQGGNIIMYYDPYKLGFSYYCDQHMSYNILNTIAMNYVLTYNCYDFFFDECVTPVPSPLLKLLEDDPQEPVLETETKVMKKVEIKDVLKNAPLAKLKNYNKVSTENPQKERERKVEEKEKEKEKPKERNRFIYLGKVNNFCILKKQPVKKYSVPITNSVYSSLFDSTSQLQTTSTVLNYRDFKNKILNKSSDVMM